MDHENKLSRALVGVADYRYYYDAANQRAFKLKVESTGNRIISVYLGPAVEIDAGGVWTKYVHEDVKRVGNGAGAAAHFHHRDHLSCRRRASGMSIRVITNASGAEVKRTTYRPYGDRALSSGTHGETEGFIGERHDDETGLQYLNARYYDPALGRFISPDWWDPNQPFVAIRPQAAATNRAK